VTRCEADLKARQRCRARAPTRRDRCESPARPPSMPPRAARACAKAKSGTRARAGSAAHFGESAALKDSLVSTTEVGITNRTADHQGHLLRSPRVIRRCLKRVVGDFVAEDSSWTGSIALSFMTLSPMTVCSPGLRAKRDDRDNSKSSVRLALAAAAAPGAKLYATPERSSILVVEDVGCRQADIGDFLFAKSNLVAHRGIPGRCFRGRSSTCCRYCGHERQRQSSGP
jgi:hypothetical protein